MSDDPDEETTVVPAEDGEEGEGRAFRLVEPEEEPGGDDSQDAADTAKDDADTNEDDGDASESDPDADGEEEGKDGDGAALPIVSVVEAVLFAAREPIKLAHIAKAVGKRTRQEAVRAAIDELNVHYLETARAFEIAEISGRFQLMSRPEYFDHIMRIYPKRELADKEVKNQRLTPAMMDTLSIVAYKQPVMRSEIEHIRGVGSGTALRSLIERGLVKEAGRRADLVGKPAVFATTDRFLVEFGLGSLDELPLRNEFINQADEGRIEITTATDDGDEGDPEGETVAETPEPAENAEDTPAEAPAEEPEDDSAPEDGAGDDAPGV